MPGSHPLIIDTRSLDDVAQALPHPPSLFDSITDDDSMLLVHYAQHPAHEVPEYCAFHHVVPIWGIQSQARIEACLGEERLLDPSFGHGASGIIPAGFNHWAAWDQEISLTVLLLHPKFLLKTAQTVAKGDRLELLPRHNTRDPVLYQLGMALKADAEAPVSMGHLYRESVATAIAIRLLSHHAVCALDVSEATRDLSYQRLHLITDFIHENLSEDIKLSDLSNLIGLSPYYLCRLFKQSLGIPLHQYLIQQRIERAKQLLKHSTLTLTEIANLCGFNSHSHLTRQFKQVVGVPPKLYRHK